MREPDIWRVFMNFAVARPGVFLGRVFEEEDDAVDRRELVEKLRVEGDEFFALNTGGAEIVEQEGEDAGIRLDWKAGLACSSGSEGKSRMWC